MLIFVGQSILIVEMDRTFAGRIKRTCSGRIKRTCSGRIKRTRDGHIKGILNLTRKDRESLEALEALESQIDSRALAARTILNNLVAANDRSSDVALKAQTEPLIEAMRAQADHILVMAQAVRVELAVWAALGDEADRAKNGLA